MSTKPSQCIRKPEVKCHKTFRTYRNCIQCRKTKELSSTFWESEPQFSDTSFNVHTSGQLASWTKLHCFSCSPAQTITDHLLLSQNFFRSLAAQTCTVTPSRSFALRFYEDIFFRSRLRRSWTSNSPFPSLPSFITEWNQLKFGEV